jgi:hypothetical protein
MSNGFGSNKMTTSFGLENLFDNVSPGAPVAGSELVNVSLAIDVIARHVEGWVGGNEQFGGRVRAGEQENKIYML